MPSFGMSGSSGYKDKMPSGYKSGRMKNFTPEMMDFFSQLMDMLGPESFLSQLAGGSEEAFDEMEAPALRQFGELQGNLASRFSGMGMGSRNSSGFSNTMNQASSDFAQNLQSQRQQMRMNAIKELQGMGNQLLQQKPYENFAVKKKPSFWESLASGAGNFLSKF